MNCRYFPPGFFQHSFLRNPETLQVPSRCWACCLTYCQQLPIITREVKFRALVLCPCLVRCCCCFNKHWTMFCETSCFTANLQGQCAFPPSLPWAGMLPSLLRFWWTWVQIMLTVKALPFRYKWTWWLLLFRSQQNHYIIPLLINYVTILMSCDKYICLQTFKSFVLCICL